MTTNKSFIKVVHLPYLMVTETTSIPDKTTINQLVEDSFGEGFRGDYNIVPQSAFGQKIVIGGVQTIARKSRIPLLYNYAGKFLTEDGSALEVLRKYKDAAQRYADAYQKETGKTAVIRFIVE